MIIFFCRKGSNQSKVKKELNYLCRVEFLCLGYHHHFIVAIQKLAKRIQIIICPGYTFD